MKSVTTSAPGKLMFFGEHAVLYGQPCIVAAIDKRVFVTITKTRQGAIEYAVKDSRFLKAAVAVFEKEYQHKISGLRITTRSELAVSGLGSSASVTVATIFALAQFFKKKIAKQRLFALSYAAVLDVQGIGSGFDVAAAVYGGIVYYIADTKEIEQLPYTDLSVIVGHSGVKAHTAQMVQKIAQKKDTKATKEIFRRIGNLVRQARTEMVQKNDQALGKLMDQNQALLVDLGVSSTSLDRLITKAKNTGAYGAKLSGAGYGDCMIALLPTNRRNQSKLHVIKAIEGAGGIIVSVSLGSRGVHVENI